MTQSLTELRRQLLAGEIDVDDLIEDSLERIGSANAGLSAFIRIEKTAALSSARQSADRYRTGCARALEGLPIAIKDNLDLAGSPTTAGMLTRKDRIATSDAGAVSRLKAAGAVIVGKLNMTEAALGADGRNMHYGDCQHPFLPGHSPGGSSSGSAAAVAGGLVPAALGTDTMGSVRIPSAYCGVWGLKPSFGLISTAGSVPVSRHLDHIGPLATSPADLHLLLDALAGFDPACPVSRPVSLSQPLSSFRLGVPDLSAVQFETAVQQAWGNTQEKLAEEQFSLSSLPALPLRAGQIRRAGLLLSEAEMLVEHSSDWASKQDEFSPQLRALLAWAEGQSARQLAEAKLLLDQARLAVNHWLKHCDFVLLPTTPQTPFRLDQPTPVNQADLTCLANCAGLPSISFPLPARKEQRPVGMQLIGRFATDRAVIAAAEKLHLALSS